MSQHCFLEIDRSLDWSNKRLTTSFRVFHNAVLLSVLCKIMPVKPTDPWWCYGTASLRCLHLVDSFQENPSELAAVSVLTPVKGTSLLKFTLYWAKSRMSQFWRNVKPCQASTAAAPLNKQEFRAWMPCQFIWDQKAQSFADKGPRPVIDLTEWLIGNKSF